MRHPARRLQEKQARIGRRRIDASAAEIVGEDEEVEGRILAAERELHAAFAGQVAVTGSLVATGPSEDGPDILGVARPLGVGDSRDAGDKDDEEDSHGGSGRRSLTV